jgi:hypothetical protein
MILSTALVWQDTSTAEESNMNTGHILRGEYPDPKAPTFPVYTVHVRTWAGCDIKKVQVVANSQKEAANKVVESITWIMPWALRVSVLDAYRKPKKNYTKKFKNP